jgi:hypothetical protein
MCQIGEKSFILVDFVSVSQPFVRFVDIDGIVDRHFLNFLFIKR